MGDDRLSLYENFDIVNSIDPGVYQRYDIKRGLRNADGTGVIAGATAISNVHGFLMYEGERRPDEGTLTLRGYSINDLVDNIEAERRFGFEETAYLLLTGKLPTAPELASFQQLIDDNRELPDGFCADMIMTMTTPDIMNAMMRAVSVLYAFDKNPEDRSAEHEVDTAISLISRLPRVMVLAYHAKRAAFFNESMIMHRFVPGQGTAETILSMLRTDRSYTREEAVMLDIMMMLHAEHGGGNNSTFTCRVLSSADTDPYSAYVGAIGSLKGARHGGANHLVEKMIADIKTNVRDWSDEGQVADYLTKIVNKEAFDQTGLVYGMGHAVYTLSDPRAILCKKYATGLAAGTEHQAELDLLKAVERLSPQIIAAKKGDGKQICANIDLYSGYVYRMLGIPSDLLTPIFAASRIVGWAAHRFEEIVSCRRVIRPAYKSVLATPERTQQSYIPIDERI